MKAVFDKFADQPCTDNSSMSESKSKFTALIRTDGLQDAMLELGAPIERGKVEELIAVMDIDENGGLDFEGFKRAVQQPPTPLEQWAGMLPLAGMLARSLPVSGGQG